MARHTFFCIDAHTCGNPVRVVVGGGPILPNVPMAEKRQIFMAQHDWVRRALMFEPRGHDVMSGSILYPPTRDDCELGVLYIEVSGCLPMCGHGTIGTVTVAIEEGLVVPRTPGRFAIEAPAGRVEVEYVQEGAFVEQVRLHNVPAYLHAVDVPITVPGLGELADRRRVWRQFLRDHRAAAGVARAGCGVRQRPGPLEPHGAAGGAGGGGAGASGGRADPGRHAHPMVRPGAERAGACAQCGVLRQCRDRPVPVRDGVVGPDGAAGGAGAAGGGDEFIHESIIGSLFDCRVEAAAHVGNRAAIKPSVAGWARITGHNTIFVDDRDPFAHGFQVG